MTVREIRQDSKMGRSRLGTLAKSVSGRAKQNNLLAVVVYGDHPATGIRLNHDGGGNIVLKLLPNTAVELVKGILMNLPDIVVGSDEELQHILKAAVASVDRDAKAVVAAVREKWSAPEPTKDTAHPEGL